MPFIAQDRKRVARKYLIAGFRTYLRFAVKRRDNRRGKMVTGIPLSTDYRVLNYYSYYGEVLAHLNQSQEAIRISQLLLQNLLDDVDTV
jgi:hypothetical protein